MKTPLILGVLLLLTVFIVWSALKEESPNTVACTMEAMICPDGTAVGRTGPNCEFAPCPIPVAPEETVVKDIIVDSPKEGDTISAPVTVTGKAPGNWFFEASFPIVVVDWDGKIIGEGYAEAQGDWMTPEYVPFVGKVIYEREVNAPYSRGAVILKKDNPSGLPENDGAIEIPIFFGGTDAGMEYPDRIGPPESVACTMDAKQCPDGSYVGRTPPSCAFAPCPSGVQ
jgi:hypothetical protein